MSFLERVKSSLLYKFKSESELVDSIKIISSNFTTNRIAISDYLQDRKLVSAYTAFFFTTNLPKLEEVMDKIGMTPEKLAEYEIVDIGSGPGTFVLAALNLNKDQSIYAVETAALMREQAMKLVSEFHVDLEIKFFSNITQVPIKKKKRLGIFGHSANEMDIKTVLDIIEKLQFDEILFIEPGTSDFFKKAIDIRRKLLKKDFSIQYPCPNQADCPMGEDDWCHQYIKVSHDNDVERLTQLTKRDRRLLPLTIHYYSKEKKENCRKSVITRVFTSNKSALRWQACEESEDDSLAIIEFEMLKRGLKKPRIKALERMLSGSRVTFKKVKDLGENRFRGVIGESVY